MTIYSLEVLLSQFGTSPLSGLLFLDLQTDFSRGRLGGLIFTSLEEFSTVCCGPHSQRLWLVNKAEVDVFLELSFFFHDTGDVGNLISGSSAFSKSILNIWTPLRRSYHTGRCSSFQKNLTVRAESQGWAGAWPKVDRSLLPMRRAAFANKTFPTIIRRWFDRIWHNTK